MGIQVTGILGLVVLVLDIWAILKVIQSGVGFGAKLVWILLILILPVIGVIIWWLFGPRGGAV